MKPFRVVCINSKAIMEEYAIQILLYHGVGLVEGEIYTVTDTVKGKYGAWCYFILELNALKRCDRFRPVDDTFGEWVEETIMKEAELETVLI